MLCQSKGPRQCPQPKQMKEKAGEWHSPGNVKQCVAGMVWRAEEHDIDVERKAEIWVGGYWRLFRWHLASIVVSFIFLYSCWFATCSFFLDLSVFLFPLLSSQWSSTRGNLLPWPSGTFLGLLNPLCLPARWSCPFRIITQESTNLSSMSKNLKANLQTGWNLTLSHMNKMDFDKNVMRISNKVTISSLGTMLPTILYREIFAN